MSTPTRPIIILSKQSSTINYAFRADVPLGQEAYYKALLGSTTVVSPVGNASDPDLPFLNAGSLTQVTGSVDLPQNVGETGAAYKTRAQTYLVAQQQSYQQAITTAVPLAFYGAYFDGSAWHNSGA